MLRGNDEQTYSSVYLQYLLPKKKNQASMVNCTS